MCVLLVEDEDLIRSLLVEVMTEAGFHVVEAMDARTALDLVATLDAPQVVVSDVNLGSGVDGFALADAAHRRWPAVPVLLMSGVDANFRDRRRGMTERFLPKPFSLAAFMQHVVSLAASANSLPI